jgi:hypothetical protein
MEEWRDIEGYEGKYIVSSEGRVAVLMMFDTSSKYARVTLSEGRKGNGHAGTTPKKRFLVHRLVAQAFCGKPKRWQTEVNHLDCDRLNNRAENLEWCTRKENAEHRGGLNRYEAWNKMPEVMEDRVVDHYLNNGRNQCATGRALGYRQGTVRRVLERKGVI